MKFVNQIYTNLPGHLNKIFEPRSQIKVKDIAEINVDALLQETYTVTTIMTDKKNADNQSVSVSTLIQYHLSFKSSLCEIYNLFCSDLYCFKIRCKSIKMKLRPGNKIVEFVIAYFDDVCGWH